MDNDYVEYFVEFGRIAHVGEDNTLSVTVQANGEDPKLAGRSSGERERISPLGTSKKTGT